MRTVPNLKVLESIPSKNKNGEQVLIEDIQKVYEWTEETQEWIPTKAGETGVTLYDLNKIACSKLPPLNEEQLTKAKEEIKRFVTDSDNTYFLMICKELSYYTMFITDSESNEDMADVVIECLNALGILVSVEYSELKVIEAWIRDDEGNAVIVFMTPYDQGVVKCRK